MAPVVFVASVQHTGTWSVIGLIQHMTGYNVTELHQVLAGEKPEGILHSHIGSADLANPPERGKYIDRLTLDMFIGLLKTIIPVRDPMRSLITRQMRHPDLQHFHIVDGFRELARLHGRARGGIHWLTLDLLVDEAQHRASEQALGAFLGAYPYKCNWTPVNQTYEQCDIRDAYTAGDIGPLEEVCTEEVHALREDKPIKEFLSTLGYDLSWM